MNDRTARRRLRKLEARTITPEQELWLRQPLREHISYITLDEYHRREQESDENARGRASVTDLRVEVVRWDPATATMIPAIIPAVPSSVLPKITTAPAVEVAPVESIDPEPDPERQSYLSRLAWRPRLTR
jgi:hypothetical protein